MPRIPVHHKVTGRIRGERNIMGNLLKKLREKENFSETECMIADYLLEHYREIGSYSTRQLARETYSSSAAIVRFSQKMGFEGYVEFKVRFLAEMMKYMENPQERYLTEKDNIPVILDKLMYMSTNTLKETHDLLEPSILVRALHLFSKMNHIDFYAIGANIYPIQMMTDSFAMAGKSSSVHESMTTQYLQAYNSPKNHLGFFISRTGENRMLLEIANCLKEKGNAIMLITADSKSTLARTADVVIPATTAEHMNEGGPRIFLLSTIYILNVLWATLMSKDDLKNQLRKEEWLSKHFHY